MLTRPLVVWGPPASGKSTVGPMLAHALGADFVDVDERIVRDAEMSIAEIFARDGEAAFRERERATLVRALEKNVVIAAGGGALLDTAFRRELLQRAHVLSLDTPRDALLARLEAGSTQRPLLAGDPSVRLDALLSARRDAYSEAHARIDADAPPIEVLRRARSACRSLNEASVLVMPLGVRSYRVTIGAASHLADEVARLSASRTIWVTDARVAKRVGGPARFGIASAGMAKVTLRGRGEADKTLASVRAVWDAALAHGIDRDAVLIGVGGGVVTDLTGFAAATLLRGVRYATAPTTLLAMVDASVGGKTGFDHATGKNLIGAFHQPSAVVCDPTVLATLPMRDRRAGLAEIAKIALACAPSLLDALERDATQLREPTPEALAPHIAPAIQAKIDVVARDERESGERALLNFGHTIGHAIERAANYALPHGECVALGVRAALALGVREGVTPPDVAARGIALLDALGMPAALARKINADVAIEALVRDKKHRRGTLRFVLCTGPGRAVVHAVSRAAALAALADVLEIRPGRSRRVPST